MHIMNILPFCSIQAKSKKLAMLFLIFNTLNLYGMLKLLFIYTDDTFYLRRENY